MLSCDPCDFIIEARESANVMFVIYINDLPLMHVHSKEIMYADDKITLNVKKAKIMTFMSDHKRK